MKSNLLLAGTCLLTAISAADTSAQSYLEAEWHLTSAITGPKATSLADALRSAASSISTRDDVVSAGIVVESVSSVFYTIETHWGVKFKTTSDPAPPAVTGGAAVAGAAALGVLGVVALL